MITNADVLNKIADVHTEILNGLVGEIAVYCIDNRVSVDDAIETEFSVLQADVARDDAAMIREAIEYIFETARERGGL